LTDESTINEDMNVAVVAATKVRELVLNCQVFVQVQEILGVISSICSINEQVSCYPTIKGSNMNIPISIQIYIYTLYIYYRYYILTIHGKYGKRPNFSFVKSS
jgi:hypothetical protein